MTSLVVRGLRKTYGGTAAVDRVDLDVAAGSLTAVVGPSGCGKTTMLRCLAGLAVPDAGTITLDGRELSGVAPERRGMSLLFPGGALFPHLDVAANVDFGLRMSGRGSPAARRERVSEVLAAVRMSGHDDRMPAQLSSGQQQRVALARAIAPEPRLLLLDEPFSALDARLRDDLQAEVLRLQRELALTTVLVTHDQSEALALADQLVVLRAGAVEQVGSPAQLYRRPRTRFVARFLGGANLLPGVADGHGLRLADGAAVPAPNGAAGAGTLVLRPETLRLHHEPQAVPDVAELPVEVCPAVFGGADRRYPVRIADATTEVMVTARAIEPEVPPGRAWLSWRAEDAGWIPDA